MKIPSINKVELVEHKFVKILFFSMSIQGQIYLLGPHNLEEVLNETWVSRKSRKKILRNFSNNWPSGIQKFQSIISIHNQILMYILVKMKQF